ncbi:TonB-dependent receptor [Kordiimonas sp.]|uniref:TonB-dependent receptor n=1 Tax=Kordiimonas sp. TaxID=1970157 RepID=UPI003A95B7FC
MRRNTREAWYSNSIRGGLLATSALALMIGAGAQAQDTDTDETTKKPNELEEIVVKGVRLSIKESLDIKRNATNIVDAIVAEDIGKFPDENLAEALQRVTGVTITRNRGEGQNISVRGLGGDYNVTTLNGRRLATENGTRDFNFDVIASELVSGIEIFKSPQANLPEGGIGAVVNIRTRRPLDLGELVVTGSAKGIYESRTKDIHPHGSFLVSNVFADGKFGALFSATYSKKTLREDTYIGEGFYDPEAGNGWITVPFDADGNGQINNDLNGDGEIGEGENADIGTGSEYFEAMIPGYVRYANAQDTRERIGFNAAFQWRPTDNLDVNFDGIYSEYNTDGHNYQLSFVNYDESWTPGIPTVTEIQRNDEGRINYLEFGNSPIVEVLNTSEPRKATTYQAGMNVAWTNEVLTLNFDASHSRSENKNTGDNRYIVARGVVDSFVIDHTAGNLLPSVTLNPALDENQPYGAHYSYNSGTNIVDKISELKFDGAWELGGDFLKTIHFGAGYSVQSKDRLTHASKNASAFSNGGQYLTRDGYEFDDGLTETFGNLTLFRLPANIFVAPAFDNFLAGEPGTHPAPWPNFDYDKLYEFYQSVNADAAEELIRASLRPDLSYEVEEKLLNAYTRATIENEFAGKPYTLDLGVRLVETKVTSSGVRRDASKVVLDENGQPVNNDYQDFTPVETKGSYFDILPSLNFRMNLTDNVIWRVAAAKVMTRPELENLSPYENISITNKTITRSNPDLDPFRANQLDTTLEWYFSDYGALTAALFWKDIKSFVDTKTTSETIGQNTWKVVQPGTSQYGADIKGFEVSYQQGFDAFLPEALHGFGTQINYTYTTSSFDDPDYEGLPFTGMSKNSYNIVGFYEQDRLQVRVAYNWRGKYVQYPDAWGGPEWVASYGQIDASASYNVSENITLFAEANNLTNARYQKYIKRSEQISYLSRFGTKISIGARVSF